MSSVVRTPSVKQRRYSSRDKFRTALGLGTVFKDPDVIVARSHSHSRGPHTRQSIDTPVSRSTRRKHRKDRSKDVRDVSFLDPANDDNPDPNLGIERRESFVVVDSTVPMEAIPNQFRRPPVRMDAQDGPWSVSVAETPHDASSYSLYIKSELAFLITFLSSTSLGAAQCHSGVMIVGARSRLVSVSL
jgi:serum/glucocorticoid-regulated kinase 2